MAPSAYRVEKTAKAASGSAQKRRQIQQLKSTVFGVGAPKPVPTGAFSDEGITISVRGADETQPPRAIKFLPKFLFAHSPYFRRILEGRDGKPRTYEYTNLSLDGRAMNHFAAYCIRDSIDDYAISPDDDDFAGILDEMIDLYLLAEKLEAIPLKNLAILKSAAMSRKHGLLLRDRHVTRIYAETKDVDHPLRRYIVAQYAWNHDAESPRFLKRRSAEKMPLDFIYDWGHVQSMKVGRGGQSPRWDPDITTQMFCSEVKAEPEVIVLDDAKSDDDGGRREEEQEEEEKDGGEDQPIPLD